MLEQQILVHLTYNEDYARKVLLYLKDVFFEDLAHRRVFKTIREHINTFNKQPTPETLKTDILTFKGISEDECKYAVQLVESFESPMEQNPDWLMARTEQFCQERAIYDALRQSILIIDGKDKNKPLHTIPTMLQDALSVSFQDRRHSMNLNSLLQNHTAPEYLIDGLFKRGYLYAMTGLTASGKTAVALCLGMHVARSVPLGDREVKGGRVMYFAGENPDDVTQRLFGMTDGLDVSAINLVVVPYASRETAELAIAELIGDRLPIAMVIVDTSTAYFAGDDENDNKDALDHAKWLRSISTRLPGNPAILVCCHPVKNADESNMLPRGGSAFLNEVDGNLACIKQGDFSVISQHGKYRDVDFPPIAFRRSVKYPEKLKSKSGKQMATIIAHVASEMAFAAAESETSVEDLRILEMLNNNPAMSLREIAEEMPWYLKTKADGTSPADAKKASRRLKQLRHKKLLDESNRLTEAGLQKLEGYLEGKRRGGNGHDRAPNNNPVVEPLRRGALGL